MLYSETKDNRFNNIFHITITTESLVYQVQSYFVEECQVQVSRYAHPPAMKKGQHTNLIFICFRNRANTISQRRKGQYFQGHSKMSMNIPRGQTPQKSL